MIYLVAIQHPDNYDASLEDETMGREIDELNDAMLAAGAWKFAGGLQTANRAKSLRAQADGQVAVTDGPYLDTKEHVGGFWLLDCGSMDEALEWGKKAVKACRVPVEVRQFIDRSELES